MQFICSALVLIAAEGQTYMIVKILRFLRGYVFDIDKEHTYFHFLHKLILTMFTGHSSAHEVMHFFLITIHVYKYIACLIIIHSSHHAFRGPT